MYKKGGFLVLELVLFLFLFSIFSCIVMSFCAHSIITLMENIKKSEQIASITSTFDWLARDIQTITDHKIFLTAPDTLTIKNAQEKITWKVRNGFLVRIFQRYAIKEQRWKKQHISHVIGAVSELFFNPLYVYHARIQSLKGITCNLTLLNGHNKVYMHQTIALRNGEL